MRKALLQLHVAVLLAGFTAILGQLIELREGPLVWWRMLITAVTLAFLPGFREFKKVSRKQLFQLFGIGAIIALHWLTFYGSIKYANVSIALVCFSAIGFFTAVFEPIMLKRKFDIVEVFLGLLTIAGIYLIFSFNPEFKTGIIVGIISALLAVIFSVLNKKMVDKIDVKTITFCELGGGWVVLTFLMPLYLYLFPAVKVIPSANDWIWLLILSWFCTVIAFILQLNALKKISTFTSNLTYNLEPVYGILLAFIFFKENKFFGTDFYLGLALILIAVLLQMLRLAKAARKI